MELVIRLLLFVIVFAIIFIFYELHILEIKVAMLKEELESARRVYMFSSWEKEHKVNE